MEGLKIPQSQIGVSKTLRLPADIVEDIQALSTLKNTSLNQVTILLIKYALENLDENDKKAMEDFKNNNNKNK